VTSSAAGTLWVRTGAYSPDYGRYRVLDAGLAELGTVVRQRPCRARWPRRALRHLGLALRPGTPVVLVVGAVDVLMLRVLRALLPLWRPLLVFDAVIPLVDTYVHDRGIVPAGSARARRLAVLERCALTGADLVLTDTTEHADRYQQLAGARPIKTCVVAVGSDWEAITEPGSPDATPPHDVVWYGSYVPLHGAATIVAAARLLDLWRVPALVSMIGTGPLRAAVEEVASDLDNVRFLGRLPPQELRVRVSRADVALGIFGGGPKAQRVVPHKVYDALAAGRPVITCDSPGIRVMLGRTPPVVLVPPDDPHALAVAIRSLLADPAARRALARSGLALHEASFTPARIASSAHDAVAALQTGRGS
jgi:glycosyltransferase involved in cell wall biosynthesis